MAKKIRVSLNLTKPHLELANDAIAVFEGLKENPAFPNPPIALDVFKAAIDAYMTAISNAADGSKKAIVERNKLQEAVARMMRQLGHWVEANCEQDLSNLRSSGFQAASMSRVPTAPLTQPVIRKVQNGPVSGQIVLQISPLSRARSYELRFAANGSDGRPGPWTLLPPYPNSRNISVTGLTPGAGYLFQVRAFGQAGLTDWSDSASRIAI